MATETAPAPSRPPAAVRRLQWFYRGLLIFWLVSPFLLVGTASLDGSAFLTAPKIVQSDTDAVYSIKWFHHPDLIAPVGRPDIWDRWLARYCENEPTHDCETNQASFLSAPPVLLAYWPATPFGAVGGILVIRLVAAALLALGMHELWKALAPRRERTAQLLVVTAALATPAAINVIVLGQNGPVLFLSACLGVTAAARSRWRLAGTAVTFAAAVLLKLFPAMLLAALVLLRRWRLLLATLAVLAVWTAVSLLVLPLPLWHEFVEAFGVIRTGSIDFPYNRSFDATVQATVLPSLRFGTLTTATLGLRVVALAAVWWWRLRKLDPDLQWAWFWLAALLCTDFVWPNYFLLLLPAVVFVVRARPDLELLLPASAAATMVILMLWTVPGPGHVVTTAVLLAAVFGLPLLVPAPLEAGEPTAGPVDAAPGAPAPG